MTEPRISPGGRREVGLPVWTLIRVGSRLAGTAPPNLFLTLARHRRLFRGWLRFAACLMPRGRLPRRTTELVILRVAHRRRCGYEFDHHVRIGRRAGVDARDLERVTEGTGWEDLAPGERAALEAADALLDHRDLDDAAWAALAAHFDEPQRIELCLLVGHYDMLATTIRTLRIAPDPKEGGPPPTD